MMRGSKSNRTSAFVALLTAATLASATLSPAAGAQPVPVPISADTFTLTILHNNDGESKLLPDEDAGFPGVARFAAQMKAMQAAAADAGSGVITLSAGDNFLASREFRISLDRDGALYDSIALSGLYDAMALGNHDFDLGPLVTVRFIDDFDPPVPFLSANLDFRREPDLVAMANAGLLAASTVVTTAGQQVGVIGAVTPMLPNISSPGNAVVSDVRSAVLAETEKLAAQGVDKIVLVSHLQDVNEEIALVADLEGVDVVIAGGGDDLLRNEGDSCMPDGEPVGPYPLLVKDSTGTDVPVITAPGGYRCIGALTVVFDGDGSILSHSGRSVGVGFDIVPDPAVQAAVIEPLAAAVAAEVEADIIGYSDVDLDGRRAMVRTQPTNLGNLLADALRATATNLAESLGTPVPHVAIQNGGGIRNDAVIPAGPITTGDTWDIAPFPNSVVVGVVPRETFHILLEQAVDRIPDAGGQFPQISGLFVAYDPGAPARETDRAGDCSLAGNPGSRIRQVALDDAVFVEDGKNLYVAKRSTEIIRDGKVVPGDPLVVATVDFLANGGDCYPLDGIEFTSLGVTYQQALADYIFKDLGGRITAGDYFPWLPMYHFSRIGVLEPLTVVVRPGDTLWGLAAYHLGSGARWREIFDRNVGRVQADGRSLRNPDLIQIGWALEMPAR